MNAVHCHYHCKIYFNIKRIIFFFYYICLFYKSNLTAQVENHYSGNRIRFHKPRRRKNAKERHKMKLNTSLNDPFTFTNNRILLLRHLNSLLCTHTLRLISTNYYYIKY